MANKSIKEVSKLMGNLDLCMFTTVSPRGMAASRPMSNNNDVDYDGDSYFFTWDDSHLTKDIKKDPHVNLSFAGSKRFKKIFVSVSGKADIVKDRTEMEEHWNPDLEAWFENGLDTPGLAMIHVRADRIKYWHGQDQGEVKLGAKSGRSRRGKKKVH